MTQALTVKQAKEIVEDALNDQGIEYEKLKARTVVFYDLGGGSIVFVSPRGMALPDKRIVSVKANLPKGVSLDLPDIIPETGVVT